MSTHHVETKLTEDGTLTVRDLPFRAGDAVEVIVVARPAKASATRTALYPLRGSPIQYVEPTEPVADQEWEALR